MTLARIEEVHLYTNSASDPIGSQELFAWIDRTNIDHVKLDYADVNILNEVIDPLNTWWREDEEGNKQPPLTSFPFVVYTEVHSDKTVSYLPRKYIAGKENIIEQLPTLYALGR